MKTNQVVIVDDNQEFLRFLESRLSKNYQTRAFSSGDEALKYMTSNEFDIAIVDLKMQGMDGMELLKKLKDLKSSGQVILMTGYSTVDTAIEAMKLGAFDYLTKPCSMEELQISIERALEKKFLLQKSESLERQCSKSRRRMKIIGSSEKMKSVMKLIRKISGSGSTLLVQGESGTGKELLAYEIHQGSARKDHPYVIIDCSVLQENLLENELFGHEKGSFTDAHAEKKGLLELANGGTLFLDEIGDLGKNLQAKLLRVLETGEFRRVGGNRVIRVDVRFIAATNKELEKEVKEKNFREDLYYRLNTVTIHVPPLRERKEDIPEIVNSFISFNHLSGVREKRLSREAMKALMEYHWPGNVRELINVIERALILSEGEQIQPHDIQVPSQKKAESETSVRQVNAGLEDSVGHFERQLIQNVLQEKKHNISEAAKALKITRQRLYRKIEKYKLD